MMNYFPTDVVKTIRYQCECCLDVYRLMCDVKSKIHRVKSLHLVYSIHWLYCVCQPHGDL